MAKQVTYLTEYFIQVNIFYSDLFIHYTFSRIQHEQILKRRRSKHHEYLQSGLFSTPPIPREASVQPIPFLLGAVLLQPAKQTRAFETSDIRLPPVPMVQSKRISPIITLDRLEQNLMQHQKSMLGSKRLNFVVFIHNHNQFRIGIESKSELSVKG